MNPRIGVVIATHNRASLLRRAISSVPDDFEIVVVDDASSDRTPHMVGELGDRVTYLRLDACRGPGVARNAGVGMATADRILFLDDDDVLLPEGPDRIRIMARTHPNVALHLHNCRWSTGVLSIPPATPTTPLTYDDWLRGRFEGELKPVVRRDVMTTHAFEDTGASGEGLLWGRIIRDLDAVVSGPPVVFYDVAHDDRLTSVSGLLERADRNAWIADRWLELFGEDQRAIAPKRWRERVRAAGLYHGLTGDRERVRDLLTMADLSLRDRTQLAAFWIAPRAALRRAFILRQRLGELRGGAGWSR